MNIYSKVIEQALINVLYKLFPESNWDTPKAMLQEFLPAGISAEETIQDLIKIPVLLKSYVDQQREIMATLATIQAAIQETQTRNGNANGYDHRTNPGGNGTLAIAGGTGAGEN